MESDEKRSSKWSFSQVKGSMDEDMVTDADLISTVEFNQDGRLLATGDKGGRVVIFQREQPVPKPQVGDVGCEEVQPPSDWCEYNVYSTFQSHEPEFDYLKSLEIEEKINKIKWLQPRYPSYFLLTTNDKTIKLWKIMERAKKSEGYNVKDENGFVLKSSRHLNSLVVPQIKPTELMVEASPKRIYANAHTYHINSISINSDQETFLSADDLRINLWHLDYDNVCFNIVDLKPVNMEDLAEVITASEFHPTECNIFLYSSSKGVVRLCDMRYRALCDNHAKMFEQSEDSSSRSFFSEIISSISDVKFDRSGNRFAARDYLTLKIWDVRREDRPYHTFQVHDYLRSKLCSLYESDSIFDKFECCWNGTDDGLITGSYNNFFRLFDLANLTDETFQASLTTPGGGAGGLNTSPSFLTPDTPLRAVRVIPGLTPQATTAQVTAPTPPSSYDLYSSRYDLSSLQDETPDLDGDDHDDDADTPEGRAATKRCKSSTATLTDDLDPSLRSSALGPARHSVGGAGFACYEPRDHPAPLVVGIDSMDFSKRILHASWHPGESILAVAAANNLYIFNKPPPVTSNNNPFRN